MADDWEVRVTLYRNGRKVQTFDALGDGPEAAMEYAATDLTRWSMQQREEAGR